MGEAALKWSELKASVLALLNASADIVGAEDAMGVQFSLCALDLQARIPRFRARDVIVFGDTDLVTDGEASVGSLPVNVSPEAWVMADAEGVLEADRKGVGQLTKVPWGARQQLAHPANKTLMEGNGYVALSANLRDFYVFPAVTDEDVLSVGYTYNKSTFLDDDLVEFPPATAQAFYAWIKAYVLKDIDKDSSYITFRSENFGSPGLYERTIKELHAAYGNGVM